MTWRSKSSGTAGHAPRLRCCVSACKSSVFKTSSPHHISESRGKERASELDEQLLHGEQRFGRCQDSRGFSTAPVRSATRPTLASRLRHVLSRSR